MNEKEGVTILKEVIEEPELTLEEMKKKISIRWGGGGVDSFLSFSNRKRWKTVADFYNQAQEYFIWCEDNPLHEYKPMIVQGEVEMVAIPKTRVFTQQGFQLYMGITPRDWTQLEKGEQGEQFQDAVKWVKTIIYNQKMSGAASNIFNSNLIIRDLGLGDSVDLRSSDGSMSPPTTITRRIVDVNDEEVSIEEDTATPKERENE